MPAFPRIFTIFILLFLIGCKFRSRTEQQPIVGVWRFWPDSRCESTGIINDELDFASDGTYSQITKLKNGTTIRSDSNSWKVLSDSTVHVDGWRNVFGATSTMKQVSADLVVDLRRPPVLGVGPLTNCSYSQPK